MNMHDQDATELPILALLIGVTATAQSLGISERALWTLTKNGEIPHVRLGRRVMYRPESLREWLSAREQRGDAGDGGNGGRGAGGPDAAEHRD